MNSQNALIKFFTLSCLALVLVAGQVFAQGGGFAEGAGQISIADAEGLNSTVSARFSVEWGDFQDVTPNIRRANILQSEVQTNFFNVETEFGPNTWIEIRRDPNGLYWVWVCHRVRICYWPCPGCCIPVWQTTCWRSHVAIVDWLPGTDLTMQLQDEQNFNQFTVTPDGTSFDITIP